MHSAAIGVAAAFPWPIAGDDAEAKRRIIDLVNNAGFDDIDAGSLAESRRRQPGTPAYRTIRRACGRGLPSSCLPITCPTTTGFG